MHQPTDLLRVPPHAWHNSDSGEREPPPPAICFSWGSTPPLPPHHCSLHAGSIIEKMVYGGWGGKGWSSSIFQVIQTATVDGYVLSYLRLILTEIDDDWPSAISNLQEVCWIWSLLSRIMVQEDADAQTSGRLYLDIVQAILIFRAETWVGNPFIGRLLGGFHHRVV